MVERAGRIYETYIEENEDLFLCLSPKKPIADDLGMIAFNFIGNDEAYCGFVIGLFVFCGDNKWDNTWEDCEFCDRGFTTESSLHLHTNEDFHKAVELSEWNNTSNVYFITMGDGYYNQHFATKDPVSFLKGFNLAKIDIDDISICDADNLRMLEMNEGYITKRDITSFLLDDPNTYIEIYDLR
jgi:hypothetical protein